jgi:hypothetical protein
MNLERQSTSDLKQWAELDASPFTEGWHFHAAAEHLEAVVRQL